MGRKVYGSKSLWVERSMGRKVYGSIERKRETNGLTIQIGCFSANISSWRYQSNEVITTLRPIPNVTCIHGHHLAKHPPCIRHSRIPAEKKQGSANLHLYHTPCLQPALSNNRMTAAEGITDGEKQLAPSAAAMAAESPDVRHDYGMGPASLHARLARLQIQVRPRGVCEAT